MQARLDYFAAVPKLLQPMIALEKTVVGSCHEHGLIELVKMRALQINGCAFCLEMHSHDAGRALLDGGADAGRRDACAGRGLRRAGAALHRGRDRRPDARHHHDQRLEPPGHRLPCSAAAARPRRTLHRGVAGPDRPRLPHDRVDGDGRGHRAGGLPALARRGPRGDHRAARQDGESALRHMLAKDAVLRSDGGGVRHVALRPILGAERIIRLYRGLARKRPAQPEPLLHLGQVNGMPGFVTLEPDGLPRAVALELREGLVAATYVIRNTETLRGFAA